MSKLNQISDNQELIALWKKFSKGDMLSFRKIYASFYKDLLRFGKIYLLENQAEDILQDYFLYLLEHRSQIAKVRNVKAYLFTGYRNRISKSIRSGKIQLIELPPDISMEEVVNDPWKEVLAKIITGLTPREKQIINLKFYKNYKTAEIAEQLQIKNQTIRNILHHSYKKMRLMLLEIEPA